MYSTWHLRLEDDAALQHAVMELASCHRGVRVGLARLEDDATSATSRKFCLGDP